MVYPYFSIKTNVVTLLEPSQQDGSNEGSQPLFLWKIIKLFFVVFFVVFF